LSSAVLAAVAVGGAQAIDDDGAHLHLRGEEA
jgi:hypothetical protein